MDNFLHIPVVKIKQFLYICIPLAEKPLDTKDQPILIFCCKIRIFIPEGPRGKETNFQKFFQIGWFFLGVFRHVKYEYKGIFVFWLRKSGENRPLWNVCFFRCEIPRAKIFNCTNNINNFKKCIKKILVKKPVIKQSLY